MGCGDPAMKGQCTGVSTNGEENMDGTDLRKFKLLRCVGV
jgi:hypothetical protein